MIKFRNPALAFFSPSRRLVTSRRAQSFFQSVVFSLFSTLLFPTKAGQQLQALHLNLPKVFDCSLLP